MGFRLWPRLSGRERRDCSGPSVNGGGGGAGAARRAGTPWTRASRRRSLVGVREPADGPGRRRVHARPRREGREDAAAGLLRGGAGGGAGDGGAAGAGGGLRRRYTKQLFRTGAAAVAVPGTVLGLEEAHRRWGTVPWAELAAPAARLAREGVELTAAAGVSAPDPGRAVAPLAGGRRDVRRAGDGGGRAVRGAGAGGDDRADRRGGRGGAVQRRAGARDGRARAARAGER